MSPYSYPQLTSFPLTYLCLPSVLAATSVILAYGSLVVINIALLPCGYICRPSLSPFSTQDFFPIHLFHFFYLFFCVRVQCCFTSTETVRTVRDGEPRTPTLIFTQLLTVQCCFTSTQTVRTVMDGEPGRPLCIFFWGGGELLSYKPARDTEQMKLRFLSEVFSFSWALSAKPSHG